MAFPIIQHVPLADRCVPLLETLVEVSLPLPLEIVATDIFQSGNEGAGRQGRGVGWGIKNASGRKQETE